jgi:hypothetical protein
LEWIACNGGLATNAALVSSSGLSEWRCWEAEDRNLELGLRLISGAEEAHGPHVCAVQSPQKAHAQLHGTRARLDIRASENPLPGICTGAIAAHASSLVDYGLEDGGVGVRVPAGSTILTSPYRPDRLWGPPRGSFPGVKAAGA